MAKIVKSADTQLLVNKVTEVGKRATLDKTRLLALSTAIAQQTGNNATEGIKTILSDGSVTPVEKKQLKLLREQISTTNTLLISEAEKCEDNDDWTSEDTETAEAYLTAYQALLSQIDGLLVDMDKTSTVDRETLTALTENYYSKQEALDYILQKYRYGISKMDFYYLATSTTTKPSPKEIISTIKPDLTAELPYLWRKQVITYVSGAGKVQVDLIGVYGEEEKSCSITCDKSSVVRNDRIDKFKKFTFTITAVGYTSKPVAYLNEEVQELAEVEGKYEFVFVMAYKNAYALRAKVMIDDVEVASINLDVVDKSTVASYVGVLSSAPTILSPTENLKDGDWYLNSNDKCVYIRDESQETGWRAITGDSYVSEDVNDLYKISECLADMIKLGSTNSTTATLLGVFQKLCANEAFIKDLFANNISSSNFQEDEDGFYAIKGFKLQSQQDSLLGLIRSADARFYNVDVKGGTLEDCTIVKKAEGTDYTIFETQDIIPSISFSASERGGTHILEDALTGGQANGNNLSLITAPTSWNIYKSYDEAQTSSDTTKVYYSDYSFTAGFTGTYTFYTPAVGSNDHFRVTISVGGNSYITQYATDGSYDTIESVDVPITKGQTVSVDFSNTIKIYSRSESVSFALLGVLFAKIKIKTWLNEYTGSYSSFTKGSKYWVALEYVSASDLNVRSPILPQSSSPLLASTLDDMGVRVLRAGTLYKPSEIAYYNLNASEVAYNAFASLPTNRTARLSTTVQIRYANTFYSVTRIRRTDSNLIFYDDNGSVLSIPKSNNYGYSFPACSTLQLEYGIIAPFLYTQANGLGQIGTQDIQYAKAYIQNIYGALTGNVTGNVNYSGDTSHKVWSAVFN